MFGDTGVAVHPDDERYKGLVGKTLILPVVERRIFRSLLYAYVDPAFGTGAVKVTPAHDPNDFEMGQRHHLEQIVVINSDGTMGEGTGNTRDLTATNAARHLSRNSQRSVRSCVQRNTSMPSGTARAAMRRLSRLCQSSGSSAWRIWRNRRLLR